MSVSKVCIVLSLSLAALSPSGVQGGEVFSDLADVVLTPQSVQHQALEAKKDAFWSVILEAAEGMKFTEHLELYRDTEKVIAGLPSENVYVREALEEALLRLRRADEVVLQQGVRSSSTASGHLRGGTLGDSIFSFLTGGQSAISQAIKQFVYGGQYTARLDSQVSQRQADVLPMLRGAADVTGNVLKDARLASSRSFDVLKYDIYNQGVPKTPQAAKDVANRLVDASSETRRRYTQFVRQTVDSIATDFTGRSDSAAATSAQSALHEAFAKAEASDRARKPIIDV